MKITRQINLSILMLGVISFSSCSEDNTTEITPNKANEQVILTRAESDNTPFQWDYTTVLGLDSLSTDKEVGTVIYPVIIKKEAPTSRSRRETSSEETTEIVVSEPSLVYVGAAFPESEFGKNFGKEIISPRNLIQISTSFPDSYMGEITQETGDFGYKKFVKDVLHSDEYKKYLETGGRESLQFQCSEYFSYSDIEKAFSANAGLAKIFSAKVQSSSKKINIKSRLLGQLISKNFSITMALPEKGLFKDISKNTSTENPVFVRSITYGKIALLSVESEYSFEEVKNAVEAGIKWKIFSAGGNYSSKDAEILQKSVITLYVISDNSDGNAEQFFSSLDDIKKTFTISYSEANIGLPIICKGCYTKDNSIFTMKTYTPDTDNRTDNGRRTPVTTYNGSNRKSTYGDSKNPTDGYNRKPTYEDRREPTNENSKTGFHSRRP